ncbi:hypothetical protein VTK73DRAFT_390 [Phialemonium thermophilum]|uniref:MFS transporter n=1 Tax=Phialemonium thermophilum TaxID=223376 RepID=A0ABR3VVF9_9PEZI
MARDWLRYLPFSHSTTPLQALTYLLGISLFSISFLVFLNSSVSFVITDLIGIKDGVGDIVGTLGFVDEVVALVACPVWGLVSDRLGVRMVAVLGYVIIGAALFLFVQARNVYPQLLLARVFFALGATAAATMVTAILPSLTDESPTPLEASAEVSGVSSHNPRDSISASLDSELTITPERFHGRSISADDRGADSATRHGGPGRKGKPSALAGFVGLFTGCGALVALSLFLPLPARFAQKEGVTMGEAVADSFYVVGCVAFLVAWFVFFGLRGLRGEEGKGWRMLLGLGRHRRGGLLVSADDGAGIGTGKTVLPYWRLLKDSVRLGFSDSDIAIGYLGGFVARASTVAISLFIPLYVNAFFIGNGFCHGSPTDPSPELKKECRQAYVLASILTGIAQLVGLICAPVFGYLSSQTRTFNIPILVATTSGIVGYVAFPQLSSPELRDDGGRGGNPGVIFLVALLGVSQIGAIVCSLGSLGRGVLRADVAPPASSAAAGGGGERQEREGERRRERGDDEETMTGDRPGEAEDTAPLLGAGERIPEEGVSRVRLKGSIAGVYSWCGGAAILLLTKLGGYLFDVWSPGAPFYMMAIFNGMLLVASLGVDVGRATRKKDSPR